jgi:hypothetical protein
MGLHGLLTEIAFKMDYCGATLLLCTSIAKIYGDVTKVT